MMTSRTFQLLLFLMALAAYAAVLTRGQIGGLL
jgi:hypothetical protein